MKTNTKILYITIVFLFLSCGSKKLTNELHIKVKMLDQQELYLSSEILPKFHDSTINQVQLSNYSNIDSLENILKSSQYEVVKVPFEKGWSLVRKGLIKPLNSFLTKEELRKFNDTYIYNYLGRKRNIQYFIPRKYETRILVYRKSQFTKIYNLLEKNLDQINIDLTRLNKTGLPANYKLELYPEQWDFYDIFVIGWLWKNIPGKDGLKTGRIGHRSAQYSGTAHRIVDRIFQLGGSVNNVITMNGDAVIDAFLWEAIYASSGIYNDDMLKGDWEGMDIWRSFRDDKTYMSFLTQTDCFFLHGTKSSQMRGYITDPADLKFAVMPKGVSFQLDKHGQYLKKGTNSITTSGWWWAIPLNSQNSKSAYKLAQHITSKVNQISECSNYGMIPVRKDIYDSIKVIFKEPWIREIYHTSYKQLLLNKQTLIPDHDKYSELIQIYNQAWKDIVINKNWSQDKKYPDRNFIKFVLEVRYLPKVRIDIK